MGKIEGVVLSSLSADAVLREIGYRLDTLQKKDKRWKCFCPIHKERIFRSLTIDLTAGRFSCGYMQCPGTRGGDLLDLFAAAKGISRNDAIRFWAERIGLPVPEKETAEEAPTESVPPPTEAEPSPSVDAGVDQEQEPAPPETVAQEVAPSGPPPDESLTARGYLARFHHLRSSGKVDQARTLLEEARERYPEDLDLLDAAADFRASEGDTETAHQALLQLAAAYREQSSKEGELRTLKRAMDLRPEDSATRMATVKLCLEQEMVREAVHYLYDGAELHEAAQNTEEAIECYRQITELDPGEARAYQHLADIYSQRNEPEPASDALLALARLYEEREILEKGCDAYRRLVELSPDNVDARRELARLYSLRGRRDEAAEVFLELSDVLLAAGHREQAADALQSVLEHQPDNGDVRCRLADVYGQLDRPEDMLKEYLTVASGYEREGEVAKAVDLYTRIYEQSPGRREAADPLVRLLIQREEKEKAKEILRRQIKLELKRDKMEQVIQPLRTLLDLEPGNNRIAVVLAQQLYRQRGEGELADFLQSHVQFLNSSASPEEALKLLQALPPELAELEAVESIRDALKPIGTPEKASAARSLEAAQRALSEGLHEEAKHLFYEAHQLGADSTASLTGLFQTAVAAGNEGEIVAALSELHHGLESAGRENETVPLCLQALERFGSHKALRRKCFESLKEIGFREGLIEALKARVAVTPGDERIVLELAELHLESGDVAASLSALDDAAEHYLQEGDPELAGKMARRALAIEPEDEKRHAALAESLARSGRIEEAAEVLVSLARRRRSQGRIPEAGHLVGRALEYSPSYLPALKEDFEASLESRDDEWVRRSARRLARAYAASELHGKATETLGRARRLLPEDPALLEEALSVYEEMGAVDRLVESVSELIRLRKAEEDDKAVLALCQRGLTFSPTNLALWEELARAEENTKGVEACEDTLIRLAGVYRDKGLNGKRMEVLARLREAFPHSARVWNLSLQALEETGNQAEMASVLTAQAGYLREEGDLGATRETLERALDVDSESVAVLHELAQVCLVMEDREAAITHFGALCEQLHSDPPPTDPQTVDILVDSYQRILEVASDLAQPRLRLASLLFHNQRVEEAAGLYRELAGGEGFTLTTEERQHVLERLVALDPEDLELLWDLAVLHREKGNRDQEIERLDSLSAKAFASNDAESTLRARSRLAELMPGEPRSWERLAEAFELGGRQEEAAEALGKAASIYLQRGDFASAEPLLAHLAEAGTESPEVLVGLARAAERNGRSAEAADCLARLAGFLLEKGEPEAAIENLRHACELEPHRREYKERLFDALAAQKSYRRATGIGLSLMASAQEEEERLRILGKILEWPMEDPEIVEGVVPAFEHLFPGKEAIRLLVKLLGQSEAVATQKGLAPATVTPPESFLAAPQFWEAFVSEAEGRSLGAAQYVQGVSSLEKQEKDELTRAVCERGLKVHGDLRPLLEPYLEVILRMEAGEEEQQPVIERLCAVCEQSGDRQGAARYRKMLRREPSEGEPVDEEEIDDSVTENRLRARQYAEAGSPHDAIFEWKKVLEAVPGDAEALEELWELSSRIGDLQAARQTGHQLAEAACLRGDIEEGILWFEKVLDRLPGDHETCQRLAELCLGLGRRPEGIEYVRKLAQIYAEQGWEEEELRVLERLRVLEPEDSDLERLAQLYEETDQRRALEIYQSILERAERRKDVSRASEAALAMVRLSGGGGDALRGLGDRLERLGEAERARTAYREAAEWFRQAAEGMKALECYRAAQRLGERDSNLCLTMATIYQDFGNLVEAEACLWQAWEILEAEEKQADLLKLTSRILALRTDNLGGYARAFSYVDSVADRLPADSLAEVRGELLEALARHPSSERVREILDEASQRWSVDETVSLDLLSALGDLLLAADCAGVTACWLAIGSRAWEAEDEAAQTRALEVFRKLDLTTDQRDAVIGMWVERGKTEEVLPEMLSQLEALKRVGQMEAALEVAHRILEVSPENERARRLLPDLLEGCGDLSAARAARLQLAQHLLESGNHEEAVSCGCDLLSRYADDEETLVGVKALFAAADHTEGLLQVGRQQVEVYLEHGSYDRAMAELEELRERAGETPELSFKMAEVAKLRGDHARALELQRQGARLYSSQEDFGRAVDNYRAILERNPDAAELRLDLAQLLWDRGFPEDAKREQSQAVELLLQQEKWTPAREAADDLLARAPDDLPVLEAAVRWAEHDQEPDRQKDLLHRLAVALVQRGERERALSVYRELMTWTPDDISVRQSLVDVLSQLGRKQEATQELLALAQLAREQGDRSRAVSAAEAAWRMNTESREASALLAEMAEEGESLPPEILCGAFAALAQSAVASDDLEEAEVWISRGMKAGVPADAFAEVQTALQQRREVPEPESSAEEQVEEAEAALEAGDVDRGRALFESLVAQAPADLVLLRRFAQALAGAGQADPAFRMLEDKAEALEQADDYEGASFCLEQLVELDPDRVEPMLQLARLQCLSRDEQGAWNTFSQALDTTLAEDSTREDQERVAAVLGDCVSRLPDRVEVWERVFQLEKELGHRTEALTALKSIHRLAHQSGRTLEAVDALQRCLAIYPVTVCRDGWRAPQDWVEEDGSIQWLQGDTAAIDESTDLEDVRHHLRQRLELATYHLRFGLQDAGTRELVMAGEIARTQGLWKQAKKFYMEALKWLKHLGERTGQRTVWDGLVEVGLALGEVDAARRSLRSWAAWEEEQGELERSLEVRKSYLESEPKDLSIREDLVARAWEWDYAEMGWEHGLTLAQHLREKDLFGRAEALYRGLIQRAKEPRFASKLADRIAEAREPLLCLLRDRGDHAAVAELQWAEAQEAKQAGDFGRAATLLEEILPQRPEDAGLLEELVTCQRQAGNEDAALDYETVLARLHRSSGMIHKALELCRSAVRARPEDEKTLAFLTACYREAGEISNACVFYWQLVNQLNKEGKLSAAVPILRQIEDLAQRAPDNWLMLAQTWTQLDEDESAGRAYYRAGMAALTAGSAEDAIARLEKAQALISDDPDVEKALEQVKQDRSRGEEVGRREQLLDAVEKARETGDRVWACRLLEEYVDEFADDVSAKEKLVELLVGLTGRQDGLAGATAALSGRQRERLLELSEGLANHYLAAGETAQGVRFIKMTVELAPERLDLQRSLMEHYVALGLESEAALQGMELAGRLAREGSPSAAISIYRDLVKLDPDNVEARSALALQLLETDHPEEAKQEFRQLAETYAHKELLGKAISALQSAVSLDAEDEELRRRMAQLYALKGNTSAALSELKYVEERHRQRGELDEAAAVLAEMVQLDAERGSIRERLAQTYIELGDRHHAFEAYRDLAHLYHERELAGRVIEAAEQALAIDGEDRELSRMLVEAYQDRGDLTAALEQARRMAGVIMQRSPVDGEQLYRDILEWAPEDAESLLALASCCERQHRDSEASDYFEHLGRLYQAQVRFLEASRMWRRALKLNGRKVALKEELAEVYLDLGDEYHGHLLLEELAEHYENLGEYEEAVNRWVRLADRHIQKAMELPA